MTNQPPPPPGNYPPPPGGYPPPPPPGGGYPPPPPPGGYPHQPQQGGYPHQPQQGGYPPPRPPGNYPPPPPPPGAPGYPPPQQGGYAPAPGGYPPPGAPGYGGAGYGGAQGFNVGEAFSWAWNKFSKNAAALIVPTLVYAVIAGVLWGIVYAIALSLAPDANYESSDSGFSYSASLGGASFAVLVLGGLVLLVVAGAIQSAYLGGLLDIANGQPVTAGSFFKPRNVGSVVVASVIIGILTAIGNFLCVIPGLIVGILTVFATVAIVDRNLKPIDGIKASFELAKANFVQALLIWLLVAVIIAVGAVLCGVGLLVAVPVATLFLVYSWRKLTGGPVAPLTP